MVISNHTVEEMEWCIATILLPPLLIVPPHYWQITMVHHHHNMLSIAQTHNDGLLIAQLNHITLFHHTIN
jgi:hypothetical protein